MPVTLPGMKMNYVLNPARILHHFGAALLIQREDGKHELVGGSDQDHTNAKEWVSLFAHEITFNRTNSRRRSALECLPPRGDVLG